MKKNVCKRCKMFYEGPTCPVCKVAEHATGWQGRISIIDAEKSLIGKNIGITIKGEYALKVR